MGRPKKQDQGKSADLSKLKLKDVLNPEQYEIYKKASQYQKKWLQVFIRTGNTNTASDEAYPGTTKSTRYQMAHRNRLLFKISVEDLYRSQGIDELKIVKKTNALLDAKKVSRKYVKGDLIEEYEEEDTYAIATGIKEATKMLRIDPGQKLVHAGDKENPITFKQLFGDLTNIKDDAPESTIKERKA